MREGGREATGTGHCCPWEHDRLRDEARQKRGHQLLGDRSARQEVLTAQQTGHGPRPPEGLAATGQSFGKNTAVFPAEWERKRAKPRGAWCGCHAGHDAPRLSAPGRGHVCGPGGLEGGALGALHFPEPARASCPRTRTHAADTRAHATDTHGHATDTHGHAHTCHGHAQTCIHTHVPCCTRARTPWTHTDVRPHTYHVAHTHKIVTEKNRQLCPQSSVAHVVTFITLLMSTTVVCHAECVAPLPWAAPHTPPWSLPARLCPPCSPSVLAPRPRPVGTRGLIRLDAPTPVGNSF